MDRIELVQQIRNKKSFLCVGLDTDVTRLPAHFRQDAAAVVEFNKAIIDATKDHCVSYKINTAFYEALGAAGWEAMEETAKYIPSTHFKIADAKRGDIGNTSGQYARAFFEKMDFDAITVAPYMGEDSVSPFLKYPGKWTIVLALTSNPGSADFQRLELSTGNASREQLYETVLRRISSWGNPANLMYVVGATRASELEHIRKIIPDHFLLVPGVGAQGGSLEDVSKFGMNSEIGLLVNASRAVIFASAGRDFAEAAARAALQYHTEMSNYIDRWGKS